MRKGSIKVQSENILPIIKKWLYSDKDIFLREIVANGCDAVSKLEKLRLIGEAPKGEEKPRINVTVDKDARIIRVEDNGIGMTEEEVEKYITQVAFSGAQEFIAHYKDKTDADSGIIGHFGLGFYSAFMISDSVDVDTLSYKEGAGSVHWESKGDSDYEIGEGTRASRGTSVTMHVSQDESEFLEVSKIREVLRKYCAFMPVEIYLNPQADTQPKPVNDPHPLWLKAPKDCTDEEYKKFYSELFMDFNPPLFWIHLNVDYPFNLKGILYFPKLTDKLQVMPGQIKLYSHQVFIADNVKEIIPEFLLLLKGVIDCPDLPLNVSRSFLQNDGDVQKISRHIAKKVSDKLHEIFKEDRAKFEGYWDDISPFLKFGCLRDESFYDRVKDILLLKTIGGKYQTLSEFPKGKDGKIFYVSDENAQAQYIRMFKEQGIAAAVLGHPIDPHFISFLEYKEKDTHFARIDSDIGDAMKNGEAEDQKIAETFKSAIGDDKLKVKAEKLKSARMPAVLLTSEYARRMQDMSRISGEKLPGETPESTLVVNVENDVVKKVPQLSEENARLACRQIYDIAKLSSESLGADELTSFIDRSMQILGMLPKSENAE